MAKICRVREGLGAIEDLTTPTSVQKYPLGAVIEVEDSTYKAVKRYMYVKSHDTLAQYGVYVIVGGGTSGAEVVTALSTDTAALTATDFFNLPCVAEVAFTASYFGWVCIEGNTTAAMAGSVTILHAVKLSTAAATFATEGAVTVTPYTAAIAVAARTGAGNTTVYLVGHDKMSYQYTA